MAEESLLKAAPACLAVPEAVVAVRGGEASIIIMPAAAAAAAPALLEEVKVDVGE